jgi:hypothetical protein
MRVRPEPLCRKKQMVRGVERWYVDFDKSIPYFAEAGLLRNMYRRVSADATNRAPQSEQPAR